MGPTLEIRIMTIVLDCAVCYSPAKCGHGEAGVENLFNQDWGFAEQGKSRPHCSVCKGSDLNNDSEISRGSG